MRSRRWIGRGVAVLLVLLIAAGAAQATTIVRLSVDEMTRIASDVVLGTCSSVESHWTDDHQQILTYVTVTDTRALKGRTSGSATFVQLGGRVGDDAMYTVGAPTFEVGEEVVVFLTRQSSKRQLAYNTDLWLIGLGQGKWRVERDAATGQAAATVSLGEGMVIRRPGRTIENSMSLAELTELVEAVAGAGEGK